MPRRDHAPNLAPIRTIGQLAEGAPGWVRLYCVTIGCGNQAAVPLAPLIERWGAEAPRSWMDTRFRCKDCHRRNTTIRLPSTMGSHGFEPLPEDIALALK